MKNKILTFIIGLLVGAIITSACFIIYNKNHKSNNGPMGEPPQMIRQDGNNTNGTPPEKPSGDSNEVPPALPDAQNNNDTNKTESQNTVNTETNTNS